MKKQLLIAAVAATMTSVAMADISISGSAKVNYTNTDFDSGVSTNTLTREMDLKLAGKSGDTTIVMNFGGMDTTGTNPTMEDNYVATSIEGVSLKAGAWDNGNNALRASGRTDNHVALSTSMGGVNVAYDAYGDAADSTVKVSGEVAGISASFKQLATGEDISLSTTVSGVKVSYLALNRDTVNTDRSVVEISGAFGGVNAKFSQADADTGVAISGDTWMGDFEGNTGTSAYLLSNGQDVTSMELSTSMAGNKVTFRNTKVDGKATEDMSFNKIIVNRALANGTTFEATYTDLDDSLAANDGTSLDLELAVKF